MKILLTTTSFQDTPGSHHDALKGLGHEVITARGPLSEAELMDLVGDIDAIICGDDEMSRTVLQKASPRLRCLSKYGIGVDKIDLEAARELGIPVSNTPGVNHMTVAEHVFALMLALAKNLVDEVSITRQGNWKRLIGTELCGKSLGIVGLGRIGKEVALRAKAFGMQVRAYDIYWDTEFAHAHDIKQRDELAELLVKADIISLHVNLSPDTRNMINRETLTTMKEGAILINCARGELVDSEAVAEALAKGTLRGYGADVLEKEPPPANHPLLSAPNCLITPHIGSRTYESVVRQGRAAVENLRLVLSGREPLARVV